MKLKLKTATMFLIISMLSATLAGCATNANADDKTQPTTVSSESKTETKIEVNTKYITDENHEGAINLPSEDGAKSDVDTSDYKNMEGYEAYISDRDTGYEGMEYFGTTEAIEESYEAYLYYKNNIRECGDYLITDYEDGVCINKYIGQGRKKDAWGSYNLDIPETLDGKPVVKIGSYIEDYDYENECEYGTYVDDIIVSAVSGWALDDLNLPKTVKYISKNALQAWIGASTNSNDYYQTALIDDINVSQDNPYYASENGELFSKDKKTLLFSDYYHNPNKDFITGDEYIVPDFVEHFHPVNTIYAQPEVLIFGKNIKKISAFIYVEEEYHEIVVKGYKGTVAEDWAKEQEAPFEAIG